MSTAVQNVIPGEFNVAYATKNGAVQTLSLEGAIHRGGAALTALKTVASDSAAVKAANGRYGPAADILAGCFPAIDKAVRALHGIPSLNAENFRALLSGIERAPEPKKGFSKKQMGCKALVAELRTIKALAGAKDNNTVEAVCREVATV